MVKHKKIFMEFFNLTPEDIVPCECCHKAVAVDVHHCEPKGMGGSKLRDYIENLIGLCRACHDEAHSNPAFNEKLKAIAADLPRRLQQMKKLMKRGC